jgi:hypothetical protein
MHMPEEVGLEFAEKANADMITFLDQGTPPIHIILDTTNVKKHPMNVAKLRQASKILDHPAVGWIVLISSNPVIHFLATVVTQITKSRYRSASSVEEAIPFLREQDQTIDWEQFDLQILN